MRSAILSCLVLLALPVAGVRAQERGTISGRITDQAGEPLGRVQVTVEGTDLDAVTNARGVYQITGVLAGDVQVRVSALGYAPAEQAVAVRADETATADFTLDVAPIDLEAIVAVGYGTQQRETLTGSIARVSGDDIATSPSPNVGGSLAGRLPGLVVNQRTGEPGRENLNILVRGTGTFGNNAPLIIIDGVERSLIERLNPDDIESVTVLKDASAAIYGARAANGVILVTTRQGVAGSPRFELSYNTTFASPTQIPDMLDAATFAEAFNEAEWYRQGRPETHTPFYSDDAIQRYRDGSDPVLYPNTDWVRDVLKPHSVQRRANLQAAGGTQNIRYLLSFGLTDQQGNLRSDPTHYRQYNLRTRIDADVTEDLSIGANVSAILNQRDYSPIGTEINFINILQANPTIVSRYPNGLIGPGRLGENPLLMDQRG
ncbi:MAG: carboxypeptidase regulatory-like domain-containing protein, partial [Longimicrobiales bacterium]